MQSFNKSPVNVTAPDPVVHVQRDRRRQLSAPPSGPKGVKPNRIQFEPWLLVLRSCLCADGDDANAALVDLMAFDPDTFAFPANFVHGGLHDV